MFRWIFRLFTHGVVFVAGIALGIYLLPILTAPKGPDSAELAAMAQNALYKAEFTRDLKGSDFLHWGEGTVTVSASVSHDGRLAPGPDYKLYLVKGFVEDEAGFEAARASAALIGDIRTFNGFITPVPAGIDVEAFDTVVVWCESFSEFITAAKYR